MLLEFQAVGAEGVRFDDADAALDVLAMDLLDEGRIRQDEFVETPVQVDALGVEHGPHAAVTEEDTVGERVEKPVLHGRLLVRSGGRIVFAADDYSILGGRVPGSVEIAGRPRYRGIGQ